MLTTNVNNNKCKFYWHLLITRDKICVMTCERFHRPEILKVGDNASLVDDNGLQEAVKSPENNGDVKVVLGETIF